MVGCTNGGMNGEGEGGTNFEVVVELGCGGRGMVDSRSVLYVAGIDVVLAVMLWDGCCEVCGGVGGVGS